MLARCDCGDTASLLPSPRGEDISEDPGGLSGMPLAAAGPCSPPAEACAGPLHRTNWPTHSTYASIVMLERDNASHSSCDTTVAMPAGASPASSACKNGPSNARMPAGVVSVPLPDLDPLVNDDTRTSAASRAAGVCSLDWTLNGESASEAGEPSFGGVDTGFGGDGGDARPSTADREDGTPG